MLAIFDNPRSQPLHHSVGLLYLSDLTQAVRYLSIVIFIASFCVRVAGAIGIATGEWTTIIHGLPLLFSLCHFLNSPIAQMVERGVSNRKVSDSRFDSRTGNVLLCSWERQLTFVYHGGAQSTSCGEPARRKTFNKNLKIVLGVGVVRQ